jgi:glutaredoxin
VSVAPTVTLFGRPGCHLCDEARASILSFAEGRPFELVEVDIEADDRLLATYLERIPVVEVEGREVSELEFDAESFQRALHTVGP